MLCDVAGLFYNLVIGFVLDVFHQECAFPDFKPKPDHCPRPGSDPIVHTHSGWGALVDGDSEIVVTVYHTGACTAYMASIRGWHIQGEAHTRVSPEALSLPRRRSPQLPERVARPLRSVRRPNLLDSNKESR